ncbi:MAG: hypothetical protein IPG77_15425 [Betaproteobacteria bacterium]|nr:hypothetical protein [Betaproteobacteria bacterium]
MDAFDAVLEFGILAHVLLKLRCWDCGHEKLVAFSCKPRGTCPSVVRRTAHGTDGGAPAHLSPPHPPRCPYSTVHPPFTRTATSVA